MQTEKPMMAQYRRIKEKHPDCVILFRLGGFYEIFNKDAYIASQISGLKITARNSGNGVLIPMCGIPKNAAEKHAKALSEKGYAVAICDQVEGETEDGIIKREVSQIISPQADIPAAMLPDDEEYAVYLAEFETEAQAALENKRIKAKKDKTEIGTGIAIADTIIKDLKKLDIGILTPYAALEILYNWKTSFDISDD